MPSKHDRRPAAAGSLKARPVARLLQQLFRKQVTGCLCITDEAGDESDIYLRGGMPVHVHGPVDADRLDRVLVEHGIVTERAVELARPLVAGGMRLGEALERTGALTKEALADVLKAQLRRKLTSLFGVPDGSFAIFLEAHRYGEGDDYAAMRVDPRTLYFPAIHAAYDLPRVTRELSRLWGQEFRLASVSSSFISAMGIPADDPVVASLRGDWLTLEKSDSVSARPLEVRAVLLSLYYADLLERQNLVVSPMPAEGTPSSAAIYLSSENLTALPASQTEPDAPSASQPPPATEPTADGSGAAPRSLSVPEAVAAIRPVLPRSSPSPDGAVPVHPASSRSSPSPGAAARTAPLRSSPSPDLGGRGPDARGTGSSAPAAHPVDTALRTALLDLAGKLDKLSHFELLGVSESAPSSEINAAFLRAARRYHPDRLAGAGLSDLTPHAERVLARMSEAAMILGDPTRRADYVASRAGKKPSGSTVPTVVEAETKFLKGEVFLKKGDYPKAIEFFTAACKANPSEPQFRAYLAWARFENPKAHKEDVAREVQRIIADVVAVQPRFARGHYWLGQIWKFLNEPGRAEQAFREAVNQDSAFIEATRELRLLGMRRTQAGTRKSRGSRGGGIMSRLFKK